MRPVFVAEGDILKKYSGGGRLHENCLGGIYNIVEGIQVPKMASFIGHLVENAFGNSGEKYPRTLRGKVSLDI